MSDSAAGLRRKIASAGELESVVRTMKAMAASNIGQYENAVRSLNDYYRTVQLGLAACLRQNPSPKSMARMTQKEPVIGVVVFGSDQGLVGQFNDVIVQFVIATLKNIPGKKIVWTVGERVQSRLEESNLPPEKRFVLPNSISAIAPLVGRILAQAEDNRVKNKIAQLYLFHNRPQSGAMYIPVTQRLLPFDAAWRRDLTATLWPTANAPEVMNDQKSTRLAFVREYLFVSLFRACAESLASENASRLAAMQRAEKNIDELLGDLNQSFHRVRQGCIDEELFDVVAGFEALSGLQ